VDSENAGPLARAAGSEIKNTGPPACEAGLKRFKGMDGERNFLNQIRQYMHAHREREREREREGEKTRERERKGKKKRKRKERDTHASCTRKDTHVRVHACMHASISPAYIPPCLSLSLHLLCPPDHPPTPTHLSNHCHHPSLSPSQSPPSLSLPPSLPSLRFLMRCLSLSSLCTRSLASHVHTHHHGTALAQRCSSLPAAEAPRYAFLCTCVRPRARMHTHIYTREYAHIRTHARTLSSVCEYIVDSNFHPRRPILK